MGLGGHLFWTAAIRDVAERTGKKVRVCGTPALSDLLCGRLYHGARDYSEDPVFRHNPRVVFPPTRKSPAWAGKVDRKFRQWTASGGGKKIWEKSVLALSALSGRIYAHVDMQEHASTLKVEKDRQIWRPAVHLSEIPLRQWRKPPSPDHAGELFFTELERRDFAAYLERSGLKKAAYLAVEPHSKEEWFGGLRAWPLDRWKELLARAVRAWPSLPIVQVGVPGREILPGARDWTDLGGFRQAALALESAGLFAGTEGGLMHAAAAVGAPALILYGCVTLPEYSGYPERHRIVCHYLPCAPSGARHACSCGGASMGGITVDEVMEALAEELRRRRMVP
jgi:hypothetical protein